MSPSESRIRQKAQLHGAVGRLGVALALAAALCLMSVSLTIAQEDDLVENFQFSYDPVSFDKSEIEGSEVFHATITGRVTCVKDLPMSAREASLTSSVAAVHTASGTRVILNSSYAIAIKPFPSKEGETAEISQVVPLQFPAQAEPGDYNVIGKIVEAKVKVVFAWVDVTGYLPQEQPMGMVKYTTTESTVAPPPSSTTTPSSATPTSPTPMAISPSLSPTLLPQSKTTPNASISPWLIKIPCPWWLLLIVFLAVATTIFNITWFWRHRTQKH